MTRFTSPSRLFLIAVTAMTLFAVGVAAKADSERVRQLRETGVCLRCDLRDATLGGFIVTDVRDSDLRGARLYKSLLVNADLTGALLTFADLKGANLRDARGAKLDGAITDERTTCPNGSMGPCQ